MINTFMSMKEFTILIIFHSGSLSQVLSHLAKGVNNDAPVRITVRRNAVWADSLREAQKKSFSASCLLKVSFMLIMSGNDYV